MGTKKYDVVLIGSGVSLYKNEGIFCDEHNLFSQDKRGATFHGTSSLRTIASICPDVRCLSLKITDENEEPSVERLISALEYVKDIDCKVIFVALSTLKNNSNLEEICDFLVSNGRIIISPLFNRQEESYPACYGTVIGIRGRYLCDDHCFRYFPNNRIQGVFDSSNHIQIIHNKSYCFSGNSRASALAVGKIVKMLKEDRNISKLEVERRLVMESNLYEEVAIYSNKIIRKTILRELLQIRPGVHSMDIIQKSLLGEEGLSKQEYLCFIDRIIGAFPFVQEYQIRPQDLSNFDDVVSFVGRSYLIEKDSKLSRERIL